MTARAHEAFCAIHSGSVSCNCGVVLTGLTGDDGQERPSPLELSAGVMLGELEALEAWDDMLGSRSVALSLWKARDELRSALEGSRS